MKKNVILFTILSLVIMFTACKKDTSLTNVKLDPTEQKILNFKEKMQNPNKSNETLSIDSAVWYIEAALNYSYCKNDEVNKSELNTIMIDSTEVYYENNSSIISYNKVQEFYDNIQNIIVTSYNELNENIKYYDLVDVKFINNKFKIYFTFIVNNLDKEKRRVLWSSTTKEIYKRANINVAYPAIGNGYFTDVDFIHRQPFWHFSTTINPYGDYLLYYSKRTTSQTPPYLNNSEITWYSNHATDALNIAKNDIPTGYSFKSWILDSQAWEYYDGWIHRAHYIDIYYGVLHSGGSQSN